jgi:hypothetical protein
MLKKITTIYDAFQTFINGNPKNDFVCALSEIKRDDNDIKFEFKYGSYNFYLKGESHNSGYGLIKTFLIDNGTPPKEIEELEIQVSGNDEIKFTEPKKVANVANPLDPNNEIDGTKIKNKESFGRSYLLQLYKSIPSITTSTD